MRIDEGKLRAYLDEALSPEELEKAEKLLADSPEARACLARLSQERDDFAQRLSALAPPSGEGSDAPAALRCLQAQVGSRSAQTETTEMVERRKWMFQSFVRRHQSAIAMLVVAAIAVGSFSFAPVRAVASDFLGIFRVQAVATVPVDPEQVEAMADDPRFRGLIKQLEPQVEGMSKEEAQKVDSLDEAAELVSFPIAQITALPDDIKSPSSIRVYKQEVVRLQLDKELLEAVFEAAEIEISLPDSLNEEPLVVIQPESVSQEWWQEEELEITFVQMTNPEVEYPSDLDLNELGVAGLQLLGMSEEEAVAFGATIDWANTLVLPIPRDARMDVTEISINGADGFAFARPDSEDEEDRGASVIWQRDGVSYLLSGDYSIDKIVKVAESVK
jgi:anti-sigma factor RsiW